MTDTGRQKPEYFASSSLIILVYIFRARGLAPDRVWMPGLVAVTANVSLAQDITTRMVRDWCASLGAE